MKYQTELRRALFLDRDGVINEDIGYAHKIEQIRFLDGIFELARTATQKSYLIFVITNQSGIARGYYTVADFLQLTEWIENQFVLNGSKITKTYYCPYHAEHGIGEYRKDSDDRKPNSGMILQAIGEYNIDPSRSILIGDKESDIEAAKSAKIGKSFLLADATELVGIMNFL